MGDTKLAQLGAFLGIDGRKLRDRILAHEQLHGVDILTKRGSKKSPRGYSTTIDTLREHMPSLFNVRAQRASEVGEGFEALRELLAEELRGVEKRCADDLAESERRALQRDRARAAETAAMSRELATLRAEVRALRFPALAPSIDGDRRRSTSEVV